MKNFEKFKQLASNSDAIVAFHIGRGGRFNNAGHLSYAGEYEIGKFTDDLFPPEDNDKEYIDSSGCKVGLTPNQAVTGIGRIDIDGQYDTTYTKFINDCNDDELMLIMNCQNYVGYNVDRILDECEEPEPEPETETED